MPSFPSLDSLKALTAWDTPTICNALEIVAPARRAYGFTRRPVVAAFPEMKPIVAFARTALIRSREPHPRDRESANKIRGDIVLGATRRNRVAEYTSADFPGAVRGVDDAFRFDLLQDG